ncbi:MAG: hypothetical protein HY820_21190 [Acidobacteria bacterium]|nr:hypothetical protein [Acidobacteriota bacterium]
MSRLLLAALLPAALFANSNGAPPRSTWVGNEQTCARSGCHTGTHNTGAGAVAISFPGNLSYVPGVKQRLTITVTDLSVPLNFGFQLTARISTNASALQAGTFTAMDNTTKVTCDDGTARTEATCPVGAPIEFIGHQAPSTTGTWQVDWTPPAANVGDIDFYITGLAGNGDGTANGDRTYLSIYRLLQANPVTITTPTVLPAGTMLSNYFVKLAATGGTAAYNWAVDGGNAPVQLASDGTLSGIPYSAGTFTFRARVYQTAAPFHTAFQQFTVTIAAAPNFTNFTIPNTNYSNVAAMNNLGDVVGTVNVDGLVSTKGFVRYANGTVQIIELPGASWTVLTGINDNGDIVGSFLTNTEHGFLRDPNGNFTSIDRPGQGTRPSGVNNQRQITGYSYGGKYNAFLYTVGGAFVDIPAANNIQSAAINNVGQVLGKRYDTAPSAGEIGVNFLRQPDGTISEFSPFNFNRFGGTGSIYSGINGKNVLISRAAILRWGEEPVSFTLPGDYTPVAINDNGQVAGTNFILAPCTGNLSSSNGVHGNGGELGSTTLLTNATCFWFAETSANWITFKRSVGPNGSSMFYTLQPNTTANTRTGTITLGGSTYTISQQGTGCTYTTGPGTINVPQTGGSGTIPVTTQANCNWNAGTLASFVTFSGSGVGSGTAPYQVPANTTYATRTAALNVAGNTVNLVQQGLPCTYTITPPQPVPGDGGSQTLFITTNSACIWQPIANVAWISITTAPPASGDGSFSFTVGQNPGTQSRTGTITVGNQIVTVFQLGAATCSYAVNTNYMSFNGAGGSGTVRITTGDGCLWSLSTDAAWIVLPNFFVAPSGSGVLTFTVAANNTAASRSGPLRIGTQTINIVQAAPFTSTGLKFVPLPPCRLMETRALYNFEGRTGAFGPPSLNAAETRTLNLQTSNVCSVPAIAKAYVVNVTLIPKTTTDFVTVWPAGDPRPAYWTVRSPDGQIVANSSIVRAGTNSGISLYTSDAADLLIDISGYYTDSTAVTGLAFYPMTPCRVIDTRVQYRPQAGPFGPPSMGSRETRKFKFPSTPYCTVPNAAAYSVTLTAVPPGALAYITAWPDGGPMPNVSSINSFAGRTLANSVIIPASADGTIDVFAYDSTDFLMDINGYLAPDDGVNGQLYFPVTQCRINDSTISGSPFPDATTRTIPVAGAVSCPGVPATARGYALNFTAIPNGNPMPFLTAFPTGQAQPTASILNAFQGQTVSNSAIIAAGANGAIDVYAYRRTDVVVEISGYFGR